MKILLIEPGKVLRPAESESFCGLAKEQIERYSELFRTPEFFLGGVVL